jgi:hypothetical protein
MTRAEQQIKSTLHRVETLVGLPLTDDELAAVLVWLAGWRALLAAGFTPEQVAAIAIQEAQATASY